MVSATEFRHRSSERLLIGPCCGLSPWGVRGWTNPTPCNGLYGAVLVVAAAALAGGVVPMAANGLQPSFSTVFLGVHGEGLLGLLGLLAGAAVALLAFRAHRVAG